MLTASLSELYYSGGSPFMHPITLMFLINIGLFIFILISTVQKKQFNPKWLEAIKQIGGLAAAFGTWGTSMGLFFAFDALEGMKEMIPLQVIMGGLKAALINVVYGLIVFLLSLLTYIVLKLISQNTKA